MQSRSNCPDPPGVSLTEFRSSADDWSDVELAEAVGRRDRQAFEALYDRFGALVYTVALRVLRSEPDAEAVASDVFFELWSNPDRLDPSRGSCRTYLIILARSRSIDRLRKRRNDAERIQQAANFRPTDQTTPPKPDAELIKRETNNLAKEALSVLSPEQAEAIRLAFFGGLTHREIADVLAQPLGTVKSRIRSGLEQLRDALSRKGVDSHGA